ncbi:fatty acid elongase [Panaeolus papilionaceus]|nr:fatty acid elongase [Panaeolus papilionaceus]
MTSLADFLLELSPYRLPTHLQAWVRGESPLSTNQVVISALVTYLVTIFSIQWFMKDKKALKLTTLFRIHNATLSSGSALLLALMLEDIGPKIWNRGFYYGLCSENSLTAVSLLGKLFDLINYYFKYLELLDTVFLALKKKPLQFLHVFHHSVTALLAYIQLNGKMSGAWSIIVMNLAVHVIMYYYYYATAGGAKFWWKKYLTSMQITQFIIGIGLGYFGTYQAVVWRYYPQMPHISNCAGSPKSSLFGCAVLTSYLYLFVNFYFQTYKKPVTKKLGSNRVADGHANGKINGSTNGSAR